MKHSFKNSFMFIMIALALLVSAWGVTPALADDETPPPPATEEPVLPTTEEPTQLPVVVTETPVVTPDPSMEPTSVPALPDEAAQAEEVPVTELLSEAPEATDVVALDETGEPLPLASQGAAEVIAQSDPKWCPEGALPNDPTCSSNFPTISALLADMADPSKLAFYSQPGVIYFERSSVTTFTDPFILDDTSLGASYDTLKTFNITLRGGWAGGTSTNLNSTSLFKDTDAYMRVGKDTNPWVGNVTIHNIQIGGNGATPVGVNTNNSLTVYTSDGDITLKNVDVQRQEGGFYTGYLQSKTGDITISNNSTFDGNDASGQLNKGFSATTESGTISISNTTFQDASGGITENYNGATLSAPVVNLTNVTARSSDGSGMYVTGTGLALVNVSGGAFNSNGTGLYGDGSGLSVNGTGSTLVNVFGGTFNNNGWYGVEVTDSILNEQSAPTCTGNGLGCYNVTPNATPSVTVNNVTVEANTFGGWKMSFSAIGSASDAEDGTPAASCTPTDGSLLPLGITTVSCTVKDSGGLTATASGSVNVVDTTAPVLSLPGDITAAATGPAGAVVSYTASATDVVSGSVAVSCAPASGSTFPLGTTTVGCSAFDGLGNTAKSSFNVTVNDTGAPVLALPANISLVVSKPSDKVVTYSVSAADLIEGPVAVSCVPASGSTFPLGTTVVNCSSTDGSGNTATGNFTVTLKDMGAPILTLPADISLVASKRSKAVVNYSASAFDSVEGPIAVTCIPASGSIFSEGTTSVKCSATDSSGNTTTGSFNVSVGIEKIELYSVIKQSEAQLPGALEQSSSFGSALKLEFTDQAKSRNLKITLSFPIPDTLRDADLMVFFWDGSEWVAIPGGNVVGSYFVVNVTKPGFYVLMKP